MSDTETEELLLESFSNFVANNIPPTWWAERLEVKVVEWARSCKDQAIYVEVKAAFSKEVAIELVEKVLRFLTKSEVKTTGVTMANFEFNSHIKVLNGSVFKSFLKIDGVGEDDWKDEEKVEALRKGLREVLQKTLSENFDPKEEKVGTVDWSFNITYQPETFKIEILELDKDHVCVYILVSPGEGNLARVKQALKAAVTACLEENVWWDATSNLSSTVVGCRTHLPGFAFRLRENFLLLDQVQVMPSTIAALSTINPIESFTPKVRRKMCVRVIYILTSKVTQPRTFFLTVTAPISVVFLLVIVGLVVCR